MVLERAADLLEAGRGRLIALMQLEGGKTLDDALAEVREAVDYCRYYAAEARRSLAPQPMPGPTGESNQLTIAAAACSSASARGIFRWPFSSARSPLRSPPAMRWWQSPPSRRR